MKKLASTMPNMILSLGTITIVAGALLGGMYSITKEPIALQAQEQQVAAIRQVAPPFDNDPEADKWTCEIHGNEFQVYPAMRGDKLEGAAVRAVSMNGFSGEIVVMCGFDADGTVRNYEVLQMAETPGLGSKMQMWFRDPSGARSVIGKNPGSTNFYVTKDTEQKGEIDGITAATISSRAFLESMRDAYKAYCDYAATKGVTVGNCGEWAEADAGSGATRGNHHKHEDKGI